MIKVVIGLVVGFVLSTQAYAEEDALSSALGSSKAVNDIGECASNFSVTGSLFSGKQFKTSAVLPEVSSQIAFRKAHAAITKIHEYKITNSDEKVGIISVIQELSSGRIIPLELHIESVSGAGTKIDYSLSLAAGMITSEDGVRNEFCKITSAVLSSAEPGSDERDKEKKEVAPMIAGSTVVPAKASESLNGGNTANSEYRKNGWPCVKEICLGDGLDELRKLKWDKVSKASTMLVKRSMDELKNNYRGQLIASAPYLVSNAGDILRFDNQTLSKLDEVIAVCTETPSLSGTFTTQSGNPTTVDIELIPTQDNNEHKWMVVSIKREFPMVSSNIQHEEIRAQLEARYGEFKVVKIFGRTQKRTNAEAYYVGDGYSFRLDTQFPSNISERWQLHPACGGKEKINID